MAKRILSEETPKRTYSITLLPENNMERARQADIDRGDNYEPVTNREIRELNSRFADPDIYLMRVTGESMMPMFQDNDILEGYRNRAPRNGDTIHCIVRGKHLLKRFYRHRDSIRLESLNPEYCDLVIKPNVSFNIVGVVEAIVSRNISNGGTGYAKN
jgi:phage repressor protein C with HTH and peptisase S24 domain